jgi:hypothetical protein
LVEDAFAVCRRIVDPHNWGNPELDDVIARIQTAPLKDKPWGELAELCDVAARRRDMGYVTFTPVAWERSEGAQIHWWFTGEEHSESYVEIVPEAGNEGATLLWSHSEEDSLPDFVVHAITGKWTEEPSSLGDDPTIHVYGRRFITPAEMVESVLRLINRQGPGMSVGPTPFGLVSDHMSEDARRVPVNPDAWRKLELLGESAQIISARLYRFSYKLRFYFSLDGAGVWAQGRVHG